MKRRTLAIFLIVMLIFVVALPVMAKQSDGLTASDKNKIVQDYEKSLKKAIKDGEFDTASDTVELYLSDDSSGEVSASGLSDMGYGRSVCDESFNWAYVMGYSQTFAYKTQAYIAVDSWIYKSTKLLNDDGDYEWWDDSVSYFHPEYLKGTVGTKWKVNGYHYIFNGVVGVAGSTTTSWTVS